MLMVFNATVNNSAVISWRSVLLVVEIYTPALYSRLIIDGTGLLQISLHGTVIV